MTHEQDVEAVRFFFSVHAPPHFTHRRQVETALDRILAENERLREALRMIAEHGTCYQRGGKRYPQEIARVALAEQAPEIEAPRDERPISEAKGRGEA